MTARVRVVDLLRLLAAFQMVQGHTLDAILAPDARQGAVFAAWTSARGLTAVAFLFVTGLSFHLSTLADVERHLRSPAAITRRVRRGLTLLGLGYLLHAPLFTLDRGLAAAVHGAVVVDVLQHIGMSLLLLEAMTLWLRSAHAVRRVCAVLAVLSLAVAPSAARLSPEGPLLPLLDYATPRGGSLFPLVPWSTHVLAGVALAPLLLGAERGGRALRFLAVAVALAVATALARGMSLPLAGMHLERLCGVVAVGAVLALLEPRAEQLPAWVWRLSGETLLIYVAHIVLVYGDVGSLRAVVGQSLAVGPALGVTVAMLLVCATLALRYPRLLRGLARRAPTG